MNRAQLCGREATSYIRRRQLEKRKSVGEKVGEKAENKTEQLEKKSVGVNVGEKVEDKAEQYKLARGRAGAVASAAASENPEENLNRRGDSRG